jgi:4-amino-4-deoxy-L-arabinose transferase-like glycosyltransferase
LAEWRAIGAISLVGFAVRLYLSLTSYCISGDGAAYLRMASEFNASEWRKPLAAVFSPLYPMLIAGLHRLIPHWELAGDLVSTLLGSGSILSIYLLIREAFGRRDLAFGAAALTAIHPALAAYSASVRTEAGYIFLTTSAAWLMLKAQRENRVAIAALAGGVAGLAYLYRTEAIGLILLAVAFPPAAALIWRDQAFSTSIRLSATLAIAALIFVAPYAVFLRSVTGHWTVGREFTAAMMFGMGSVEHDTADWRKLGFSFNASPLAAVLGNPRLYFAKVRADLVASFYNFAQAEGPVILILLGVGVWVRGRQIFASAAEAFLALVVVFYFGGFALSYTGARFMIHLIPYTFGWVMIGLEALSEALRRLLAQSGWMVPASAPAAIVALILLPQTLWPIGYDMRGVRYAGELIAQHNNSASAVIARDGRVAWYASARFIALPTGPVPSLCQWLAAQDNAGYVLIGRDDERRFAATPASSPCLEFFQRYPRYGAGYYDLYAVRHDGVNR